RVHVRHRRVFKVRTAPGAKATTLVARCVRHPHVIPCATTTTTSTTTTMTSMTTCTSVFCSPALSFTTTGAPESCGGAGVSPPPGVPASGAIFADTAGTAKINDLALGCLYIGGGKATTFPPSLIPYGATNYFMVSG